MAAIIRVAMDMNSETFTADFAQSLKYGTSAMAAAMDAVNGGSAENALVYTSEISLGLPNGPRELDFGDGAAALTRRNKPLACQW